jgi:Protein of unknown function (DUF3071)
MQDLQLIGVHEDGEHLLLIGADGERFQMPVNEALRAAIRRDRPRLGQLQLEVDGGLRPRDVQALIRAGHSSEETASRAGWSVEKVHRYEGPILAEREHVAGLAQRVRLRSHTSFSSGASAPTLSSRVSERLKARDVEVPDASWDSWRTEGGPWIVVLTFAAGGRQRQASWSFDLADRTVSAMDDEARWLSEEVEEAKGPIPAPKPRPAAGRDTTVYDVEAEGGLQAATREDRADDPLDLMTAMRKRSTARGRRKSGGRSTSIRPPNSATASPEADTQAAEEALPLEDLKPMPPRKSEPSASVIEVADDESLAEEGSAVEQTSHAEGDKTHEPVEKDLHQGHSKARPKRPSHEAARKTGRPSVPAWDEIMFGSRPGIDRSSH